MHSLAAAVGTSPSIGALLIVLAAVALFLGAVGLLGRWAAATHPAPAAPTAIVVPVASAAPLAVQEIVASGIEGVPAEVLAAIAAAVGLTFGPCVRIARIVPTSAPQTEVTTSVEALMQQWSMEGRRQIYSSHRFR